MVVIANDCWFLILGAKVLDFKFCEIKAVNIVVLDHEQETHAFIGEAKQSNVQLKTNITSCSPPYFCKDLYLLIS